jgi:hypothetical protein
MSKLCYFTSLLLKLLEILPTFWYISNERHDNNRDNSTQHGGILLSHNKPYTHMFLGSAALLINLKIKQINSDWEQYCIDNFFQNKSFATPHGIKLVNWHNTWKILVNWHNTWKILVNWHNTLKINTINMSNLA